MMMIQVYDIYYIHIYIYKVFNIPKYSYFNKNFFLVLCFNI